MILSKRRDSGLTGKDLFCGAGGTTIGAKKAGINVKMALNHWKLAIETHNYNNPEVDHDCTDISACRPERYPKTDILFASPECTNHSNAKGSKKRHENQLRLFLEGKISEDELAARERSRATMWDVPRFAEYHGYETIVIENVVEAREWSMWDAWLMAMHSLGYQHKCLYLNSRFFLPCPQSRDRMYVVFWKKGNKMPDLEYRPMAPCQKCGNKEAYQHFKNPKKKYGKYNQQYVYRCSSCYEEVVPYYYAAFNLIDWSIPITRIGDRKRPLVKKTMDRIQYGLDRYGQSQMIVTTRYSSGISCRVKNGFQDPLPTQTGDHGTHYLLSSIMINRSSYLGPSKMLIEPLSTQTTHQDGNLIVPPAIVELRGNSNARSSQEPLSTVTTGGPNHALMVSNYTPGYTKTLDQSIGSITTSPQQALLTSDSWNSFLTYYYGKMGASGIDKPVGTMTTVERAAITMSAPDIMDCYYRCLKPNEIQRAMAFGDDYQVLGTSKQKVKQLGNAVTPPVMEWITNQVVTALS